MKFHIREIVLWPRDADLPPKRVLFTEGALNVISGVSRTGKSAVIPIIDYCLGSDICTIPVSTIRDRCSWFGIIVVTPFGEKLLARREPGAQRATGDMFVLDGATVEPPHSIATKNTTVDAVKRALDELSGLTLLDFNPERTGTGYKGRPSFRDLMAFTFQPQNIIANQNVLFFKADTTEHREKIRTIFPYVLGALSPELLGKQHELSQLRKDLARKERELQTLRRISERWIAEIRAWESQARELGLITASDADDSVNTIIDRLRIVVRTANRSPQVTEGAIDASVRELIALQREESERATVVAQLRRRLSEMEQLRDTATQYRGQLQVQRDRLQVAKWLGDLHTAEHSCPLCGQNMASAHEGVVSLLKALEQIEQSAGQFVGVPAAFDRELQRVREDLRPALEQLEGIRHRIRILSRSSEEAKARHDATLEASRFIGRLEQSLENYERLGDDGELAHEVDELRSRVRALESEVQEAEVGKRTGIALKRISRNAERLMPKLDTERPRDPVELLISELTVRVTGKDREDYLWEIGSGSNWLSYHLAIMLALQQFFLTLASSPVPSFLVFDQPSQVYFPKRL
ncbi:MAG TPA: DUF3732 domain-containing protein, partial [Thermoanaerobaculia bacterium]|nr:DUF3732 domain-containing protein [Thermoanaerobaculia bacterium]